MSEAVSEVMVRLKDMLMAELEDYQKKHRKHSNNEMRDVRLIALRCAGKLSQEVGNPDKQDELRDVLYECAKEMMKIK